MHGVVEVTGDLHREGAVVERPVPACRRRILPLPMKITAFISPVAEQKTASEALVLPVLAQAARRAADDAGVAERPPSCRYP